MANRYPQLEPIGMLIFLVGLALITVFHTWVGYPLAALGVAAVITRSK